MIGPNSDGTGFRYASAMLLVFFLIVFPVRRGSAQALRITGGAVGGLVAGMVLTTGTVVLEARLGRYIFSLDELAAIRPETLPVLVMPVVGAVMGARSGATLRRAAVGGVLGLAGGVAIGSIAGSKIWPTPEGPWAGGIIGGAAGMLAGAIVYSIIGSSDSGDGPAPPVTLSLRLPWGRR